jgi:uncharacterized protein YfaS (alpha-2-macroglobulin family)
MIIGASKHSYVSSEKTIPVKQALMVLPTIPRVARPGDIFDLPVSVFAMDSSISTAAVSLHTSSNLTTPPGSDTRAVNFPKPGEQDTRFEIRAGNRIGADTLTVKAVSGEHSADNTVHLPVVSPHPFYTDVLDTTVLGNQSIILIPEKFGLDGTNKAKLAVSRLPDIQLDKRYAYLIRYPYGCIEQTVSSAFPQLFLPNLVDLKSHQKQAMTDNINATIKRLSRYQMSSGFSFWPLSDYSRPRYSEWGTNYAGHLLIVARDRGYHVPPSLYNQWLGDARQNAKKVNKKNHRYQTYRLFLLALSGNPNMGAMNLVRENYVADLDALSRKFLAAAYFLSGKTDIAQKIDAAASTNVLSYRELGGTYGSTLRDQALMTYLCLVMDDQRTAAGLLQRVAKRFRPGGWYSTQETAVSILAIGTYYKRVPFTGGTVRFRVEMPGYDNTIQLSGYQTGLDLKEKWGQEVRITNTHSDPIFVSLVTEGIPLQDRIKTEHKGIELMRRFYGDDGLPLTVDKQAQGDAFWVVYTVTSTFSERIEELALSSIFPSGWEIVNPRLAETAPPQWVQNMRATNGEYMDIRDDRVNWFFNLSPNQRAVFALKINPTFRGIYKLPAVSCEAMYSPEFYARIASGQVEVK